jgi:hypothetical protein
MNRLKNNLKNNFVTGDAQFFRKNTVSLAAIGLYFYLSSKPEGWDFSITRMAKELANGESSIQNAAKELASIGVLLRIPKREGGKMAGWEWILHPTPEELENTQDPIHRTPQNRAFGKMGTSQDPEITQDPENREFEENPRTPKNRGDGNRAFGNSTDGIGGYKVKKEEQRSKNKEVRERKKRAEAKKIEELNNEEREQLFAHALLKDQALQFEKFENYYLARNMELSNWPRAYDSWLAKAVEFEKDNWRERTPRLEKMKLRNTTTGEIEEQEVYYCRIAGYIVFPDGTYRKAQAKQQEAEQEQEPTYRRDVSKLLEGVRNACAY